MIDKIREKINYLKENYKIIWINFKNSFKNPQTRRKYIILSLIVLINILIIKLFNTFAYYTDDDGIPIIQASVGDFQFNDRDYILLVYLEDANASGNGIGTYHLSFGVPSIGYKYKSYNCKNNSKLEFNENTREVTATLKERDVCSIYFDLSVTLDLNVRVMLEESHGSNTYVLSNNIPSSGYTYSHYECMNGGTVSYDKSTNSLSLASTKKEYCVAYFKKNA